MLSAAPDLTTAIAYAWAWFAPFYFGPGTVKNLLLIMLLEFLVVHSGGCIGLTVLSETVSRRAKTMTILGFGAVYMLFAVGFSLGFHSWWPAVSFFWLLAAKFALVWLTPLPRAEEAQRLNTLWAISVVFYLFAVFIGILLPLPRFGLGTDIVPMLGLSGSGAWIEHPHTAIASGMLYFLAVAWSKWAYRPEWARSFLPNRNG